MNKENFIKRFKPKCFYHFTDLRNIPTIRENGLLSLAELQNRKITKFYPAGNQLSQNVDSSKGLNKFVHLCLHYNHPMEYIARMQGRVANTIFLAVSLDVLEVTGVRFTSGVANKAGVCLLHPEDAYSELDFEVIYDGLNFSESCVRERHNIAVRYELLVPNYIPLKYITLPNYI